MHQVEGRRQERPSIHTRRFLLVSSPKTSQDLRLSLLPFYHTRVLTTALHSLFRASSSSLLSLPTSVTRFPETAKEEDPPKIQVVEALPVVLCYIPEPALSRKPAPPTTTKHPPCRASKAERQARIKHRRYPNNNTKPAPQTTTNPDHLRWPFPATQLSGNASPWPYTWTRRKGREDTNYQARKSSHHSFYSTPPTLRLLLYASYRIPLTLRLRLPPLAPPLLLLISILTRSSETTG